MLARFGPQPAAYLQRAENSFKGGYEAARQLLALPEPPTAIVALDDVMAIGAMSAAYDAGFMVPRALSVIGFDDMEVSAYIRPALTTLYQSIEEIGKTALHMLLAMINEGSYCDDCPHVSLELQLVVRDSCAPPRLPKAG
jgi:LacI family transcriptional regulator